MIHHSAVVSNNAEIDESTNIGSLPIGGGKSIQGEFIDLTLGSESVELFIPEDAPIGEIEFFYDVYDSYSC